MAKIGTAHVEIKPVLNDEALADITAAIADAVRAGIEVALGGGTPPAQGPKRSHEDAEVIVAALRNRTEHYRDRA